MLEYKPLDKITVQELCDQAEIHRSTFYKHFSSIFDVVAYITKEITEALMYQAESAADGDIYFDFITDFICGTGKRFAIFTENVTEK